MKKPIIAIIDNDKTIISSLSNLIHSKNYQVDSYHSAVQFLIALPSSKPICLITEIRIPAISGLELQIILNMRKLHLSIVFVTAHGDIPMAVDAIQNGALHFLTKPINQQMLLEAIHKAVRLDIIAESKMPMLHNFIPNFEHLVNMRSCA